MKSLLIRIIKWVLFIIAGFAIGFAIAYSIGTTLPVRYQAYKSKSFIYDKALIWRVLTDMENYTKWKPHVVRVELLGRDDQGHSQWREYFTNKAPIVYKISKEVAGKSIEIKISKTENPIQSTWIYRLSQNKQYGIVHFKQFVTIDRPFKRFEAKYIDGYMGQIDRLIFALNTRLKKVQSDLEEAAE